MPRILAVEIPGEKKLPYSLAYIYGIGLPLAKQIIEATGIDPDRRAKTLSEEEINKISEAVIAKGRVIFQVIEVRGDDFHFKPQRPQFLRDKVLNIVFMIWQASGLYELLQKGDQFLAG